MYVFFIFLIRSSHIQCGSERTKRTPSELRRNSRPNNVNEDNFKAQAPRQVNHKDQVNPLNQREKARENPSHPREHNVKANDMRTGTLPVVRVQILIIIQLLQFPITIPMLVNYLEGMLLKLNCMTMTQWST